MDHDLSVHKRNQLNEASAGAEQLLGNGEPFYTQFQRTGALSDLKKAISLTPDDHPDKASYLTTLGNSLRWEFARTGMLSDIEESIESLQQAMSLTSGGHPDKPGRLDDLGRSFQDRFERTGILSDIEEAITNFQQAVILTPNGHPDKPGRLNNLGSSFHGRSKYTGTLSDLEEAIKNRQQAVLLTPDGHPNKPGRLNELGSSFHRRFKHTRTLGDIEEAIKNQQQAVSLTPDGHPSKPAYLNNLGSSLGDRFDCTGMLSDLEEAIKNHQQSVSLAPDSRPNKSRQFINLGLSFLIRFKHKGMLSDLEEAIKNHQQAVSITPDGHLRRPGQLNSLGNCFKTRFDHTGSLDDLGQAILNYRSAATSKVGSTLIRCRAARRWARSEAIRDPTSALDAYRHTINLLPQLAWVGDPIPTRHSQLTTFGDLPREAAAFALDTGRPDLALEWIEQGRSVVWNQLLNLRISVDSLRQAHPDICAEFTKVSHELRSAATRAQAIDISDDTKMSLEEEIQRHHRLAERWDLLVEEIRSLSGFEDFLLPKRLSALKEAARFGPVVIINVHQRRCDALILKQDEDAVLHIPLQKLRYEDLIKMRKILQEDLVQYVSRGSTATGGSPRVSGILSGLFSNVVDPILKGLGLTAMGAGFDSADLPRIWWCPTGPLTSLPLHAACRNTGAKIDGTFNYVISSYTPTVNALLQARAVKQQPFNGLVGIAMMNTPEEIPLPSVETEMGMIREFVSDDRGQKFDILWNEQATSDRVLAYMANSSWVHLACHAVQDQGEPIRSGFYLHDRRLTITDMVTKSFDHADFAFLSACETATGDKKMSDEAMHITGAMLGAGYRSVIGTMWAIPDEAAPIIAKKVYEILLSGEPNSDRAARALHEAVKEVRESDHDLFNFWVSFVHYGV